MKTRIHTLRNSVVSVCVRECVCACVRAQWLELRCVTWCRSASRVTCARAYPIPIDVPNFIGIHIFTYLREKNETWCVSVCVCARKSLYLRAHYDTAKIYSLIVCTCLSISDKSCYHKTDSKAWCHTLKTRARMVSS